MTMELKNEVAIVTGGGSGIGKAISIHFAEAGARVIVADIEEEKGLKTVNTILDSGHEAIFFKVDVTNENDVELMKERTLEQYGSIDILVNNAGIYQVGSIEETSLEDWRKIHAVNLDAVFICSKKVLPQMQKQSRGSIINIASGAGFFGVPRQAAYCSSKGGVVLLTKQMALDYADDGIRVNAVCPGAVDTALMQIKFDAEKDPVDARNNYEASLPLRRMLSPQEVAVQVLYLASHSSFFLTGHCVLI